MDPIYKFLHENLGFSTKALHGLKPHQKISLLADHYGFGHLPKLLKEYEKSILNEFAQLQHKNSESFQLVYEKHLAKQLGNCGPEKELDEHKIVICNLPGSKFYQSKEWRDLRYKALKTFGNKCFACGRGPKNGAIIHVDHILPRSIYPEFALRFNNLQILCEDCNLGKSNTDTKKWM